MRPVHTRKVTGSSPVTATRCRVSIRYLGASAIVDEEKLAVLSELCIFRPDGQEVKTSPFHGGNPGSIPGRVTNKRSTPKGVLFLLPTGDRSQTWVIGVVEGSGGAFHSRSSAQRR